MACIVHYLFGRGISTKPTCHNVPSPNSYMYAKPLYSSNLLKRPYTDPIAQKSKHYPYTLHLSLFAILPSTSLQPRYRPAMISTYLPPFFPFFTVPPFLGAGPPNKSSILLA